MDGVLRGEKKPTPPGTEPRVSILVLMDGVLRGIWILTIMILARVSILVLMDGVLRENARHRMRQA